MSSRNVPRVERRRRLVFVVGVMSFVAFSGAAVTLGSGCIFDEGGYDGGGRRVGAPETPPPDDTIVVVVPPPTTTSPIPEAGSQAD